MAAVGVPRELGWQLSLSPAETPALGAGRERGSHWGSAPLLVPRCRHRSRLGRIVPFLPGWFLSARPSRTGCGLGHQPAALPVVPAVWRGGLPLGMGVSRCRWGQRLYLAVPLVLTPPGLRTR